MRRIEHLDRSAERETIGVEGGSDTRRNAHSVLQRLLPPATALTVGIGLTLSPDGEAATFNVTNLNDSGAGSLRQATVDANTAAGADIITFQSGLTGTITLTTGQLALYDSVTIQGPGAGVLAVSGNNASRVFYLYLAQGTIDVTISGLTIRNGNDTDGGGIIDFDENLTLDSVVITANTASGDGGGLKADGFNMNLTIRNSTISGNTAASTGGGIYVEDTGGPMLVQNTIISGNTATKGGGAYFYDPDDAVTFDSCTISGNTATSKGGGIYFYDTDGGPVTFTHTTISGNSASSGGGVYLYNPDDPVVFEDSTISGNRATSGSGGGIYLYNVPTGVTLRNSTIATNTATVSGGGLIVNSGTVDLRNDILGDNTAPNNPDLSNSFGAPKSAAATGAKAVAGGPTITVNYTLIENPGTTVFTNGAGNIIGQDPQLGPLQDNGGPTLTQAPAASSPVVNTGDPAFVPPPATDQRGRQRVLAGRIDMGAVELGQNIIQQDVPTMSNTSRGLLAGLMSLLGLGFLRRRSRNAALLLAGGLAAAGACDPVSAGESAAVVNGRVATVQHTGTIYTFVLSDGHAITVDASKAQFKDKRAHAHSPVTGIAGIAPDSTVRVKTHMRRDGTTRTKVVLLDPNRIENKSP